METEIITAYVSLGSNLGDKAGNLLLAVRGLLEASFMVFRLSGIYETEPHEVSKEHENYLNMVAEIHLHNVTQTQMMARMMRIEYLLGRRFKGENKPRTIDLDILFFGDTIIENENLQIPHPRLHLRNFVLVPMAEIAPHFVHPVFGSTIQELLEASPDKSKVIRWQPYIEEKSLTA